MIEDGASSHRFRSLCTILLSKIGILREGEGGGGGEGGSGEEFEKFLEGRVRGLGFLGGAEGVEGRVEVVRFLCSEVQMEQMLREGGEREEDEGEMECDDEEGVLDGLLNKMCRELRVDKDLSMATPLKVLREVRREIEKREEKGAGRWLKEGEGLNEEERGLLVEVGKMMEKVIFFFVYYFFSFLFFSFFFFFFLFFFFFFFSFLFFFSFFFFLFFSPRHLGKLPPFFFSLL